ncbi:energy transducer TonB [Sphingomonas parva]|uniref:Energy transducer TonB n=1 Tax=Sphingomonas parva TaxID=2555898 RepID=A0A4Y8ZPA1_9SPHN|nr:energy transducer TonB [Sphingomonas parva]TFI57267.1 energy transducer TonB [Sphingomonas parva]
MQGSFAQPTRSNGTAIAIVMAMHAAGITALALAKTEVFKRPPGIIEVTSIPLPKDPPPPPKPVEQVKKQVEPQHISEVFVPEPIVATPVAPVFVETTQTPRVDPPAWTPPGITEAKPLADPPAPEPKKIESARARANLASYVSDADYPAAAIRGEEQGVARFQLSVGTNGRVTGCTITGSSGSSALDAATCRIMKQRARFTPARDSAGNPTTDTVSNAIKWVLPE